MALLGQSAFLKALGWALLNSVWQMGLLWVMFLLLTACMRKLTAQSKHNLAVLLLGVGFAWFATTLAGQYLTYSEQPLVIRVPASDATPETVLGYFGILTKGLEFAVPYLSVLYLAVTLFLFFRFAAQYRYTNRLCTQDVHKPNVQIRLYVQQIAERMGIKKNIRVWLSDIVDTPMTIGFIKPIILMPIASVNGLSIQQVEAILLHELSHIKRNDYFVNLLIASVDLLLFFNPFSKLFVRCIRKEREHSCDDLVMQFEYNAHAYASALLAIERKRVMRMSLAMAATGRSNQLLLDRVKRILNQPVSKQYNNRLAPLLFSALMLAFIAWSNPGNVIVRQILHIETPEPLAVSNEPETRQISFVETPQPPVKKETEKAKKYTVSIKLKEQQDKEVKEQVLSDLAEYDLLQVNNNAFAPAVVQAGFEKMRDFSIAEPTTTPPGTVEQSFTPFVPSSSFSYYFIQDSTKPTVKVESTEEKAARETLRKALKAIDEIDWSSLEKQLQASGEKVDIKKLREELKKSLKDLDWEKVNVEAKIEALKEQTKVNEIKFYNEMKNSVQAQNGQMQEHFSNMQKKIVEDQLKCQQDVQKKEVELKRYLNNKKAKVKKIVEI